MHRTDRTAGTGDTVRAALTDLAYPFLGQLFRLGTADPATVPIFIAINRYIDGMVLRNYGRVPLNAPALLSSIRVSRSRSVLGLPNSRSVDGLPNLINRPTRTPSGICSRKTTMRIFHHIGRAPGTCATTELAYESRHTKIRREPS